MKKKLVVDLVKLQRVNSYLSKINATALHDITWIMGGNKVRVNKAAIEEWRFVGLNNYTFGKELLEREKAKGKENE